MPVMQHVTLQAWKFAVRETISPLGTLQSLKIILLQNILTCEEKAKI